MKHTFTLALFLIITLTVCGQGNNQSKSENNINHSDTVLKTGWYYVSDQETNFKRQLYKSSDFFYINPDAIVTVENFEELKITENEFNGNKYSSLIIRFDKQGTENWSIATKKSIGNQLALIIDDKLMSVPKVNAQITVGVSSLSGVGTKEELEEILKQIGVNETVKPIAVSDEIIYLPTPQLEGLISVEKALYNRRSHRNFQDREISLENLSQILWAAYGVTLPNTDYDFLRGGFRTAPSAGGLYPLDIYVAVGKVSGIASGLYKYISEEHKMIRIIDKDIRLELCSAALGQPMVKEAPVSLIYTAVFSRTTEKYGQRGRERYVCMDLGHSAQNVYLQVEALGLGTCASAAFSDSFLSMILKLSKEEEPLYIMPIGHNK